MSCKLVFRNKKTNQEPGSNFKNIIFELKITDHEQT